MLYKSLGLLALAAVTSAQSGGIFSNTTSIPTSTGTGSPTLPTGAPYAGIVAGWEYVGCAAPPASSGFPGYTLALKSQNLTIESCATSCSSYVFFGTSGDSCFCTNGVQDGTTIRPDSQCDTRCPGNKAEACGHSDNSPFGRRQVNQVSTNGGQLLSLYRKDIIPVGDIYIDINIIIYVDVCPTGLTTVTYCEAVTMTGCGCTEKTTPPPVPMTTTTTICTACGPGTKTVTLTIPTAACTTNVPVGPPTGPKPTTKPCEGPSCPQPPCKGPSCPQVSQPAKPAPPCEGPSCPQASQPAQPAPPCEGPACIATATATGTAVCVGPSCPATATSSIRPVFTGGAVSRGFSGGLALVAGAIALL